MNEPGGLGGQRRRRRRMRPGRASLNQALISLAVAAVGYLVGVLLPLAVSSGSSGTGRMFFAPIGGIISGLFAVMAIVIGLRVRRFFDRAGDVQLQRIAAIMDIDREKRLAAAGIMLGVLCMIINPLIVYIIIAIVRH